MAERRSRYGDTLAATEIGSGLILLVKLNNGRARNGNSCDVSLLIVIAGNHIDTHAAADITECL
jgi:hypothetical protein